ncbi:unnamed protein product [Euphydryas editha]|uniref:Uncharacterized protein n=1 Tax=Euphydryas editha TaxID=104508 RepID=A0AAU9U9P4_EUPED|nr:unnamed protein product [Euphydryas editha]
MHRCSVFTNSCLNVPVHPISKMPKTAYEHNEETTIEQCSTKSSTSLSDTGIDADAEKLKDFYRSIPDYSDINHLSENEFYSILKRLREKKKLMLGLAIEHIDDCKVYDDKTFVKSVKDICPKTNLNYFHETNSTKRGNEKVKQICKNYDGKQKTTKREVRQSDSAVNKNVGEESDKNLRVGHPKNSVITLKENSKLNRPNRNHSVCSISWHDDKVDEKNNEVNKKFDQYFEGNRRLNDDDLYKTQSMPSSPLRTRSMGSNLRRHRKSITVPKPFKMTVRDEEDRIVNELRSLQKSLSEDMLNHKNEKKRFRAKPVPIESRISLYDKILQDQAMSTVCIVSGGNIDSGRLSRTIQRGLGVCGRMMRFAMALPDHCRGLEMLAKTIADERAVLKSLITEQMWVHSDIGITWANVVVETANEEHATYFKSKLRDLYPTIRFAMVDIDDKNKLGLQ